MCPSDIASVLDPMPKFPLRFVFDFGNKAEGDPPDVCIEDGDGTAWLEVHEEPILTGFGVPCEHSEARNEANEETGTYSWEAEDWTLGPFAKRLEAVMQEAGLVHAIDREPRQHLAEARVAELEKKLIAERELAQKIVGQLERIPPRCAHCGHKSATCLGSYEGDPEAYACDDCCGHGQGDGHCVRLVDLPQVVENLRDQASDEPFFQNQVEGEIRQREAAEARVAELEALIAENEWEGYSTDSILCQHCRGNQFGPGHEPDCPWGQAADNHRARMALAERTLEASS